MADPKIKQFILETKVLDETNRIISMIGSTETNDRVGDSMKMSGAKLDNYMKNPIILCNHDYHSQAVAKSLDVQVQGNKLVFKIQFAETDLGKEWFYLYANKYMNASSIGFNPIEYKPNDKGGYDFTSWELLELSLVTVPCNPEAIQRAYSDGKISKGLYDQINKNESEDLLKMKEEDLKLLIDASITEKVTAKDTEIKNLTDKLTALETKLSEKEVIKTGASLSAANVDKLSAICSKIDASVDELSAFITSCTGVTPSDPDEDKDYSEEEIQKLVQANLNKILGGK